MKTGSEQIAQERSEQIHKHGFDVAHDDYKHGELVEAALFSLHPNGEFANRWPEDWSAHFFYKIKDKTRLERLAVAGAFIAAEIDRMQRKGCSNEVMPPPPSCGELEHPLHPPIAEVVPTTHNEHIECLRCGHHQDAIVEHAVSWNTCVHSCEKCKYLMIERELKRVPKVAEVTVGHVVWPFEPHPLHPPTEKQTEQPHPLTGTYQFP